MVKSIKGLASTFTKLAVLLCVISVTFSACSSSSSGSVDGTLDKYENLCNDVVKAIESKDDSKIESIQMEAVNLMLELATKAAEMTPAQTERLDKITAKFEAEMGKAIDKAVPGVEE